jgi:hypothetical protein
MKISNYSAYLYGMQMSLQDKLFWTKIIPHDDIDTIIDFGCADGTLLDAIDKEQIQLKDEKRIDRLWCLVGIDNNPEMLKKMGEKHSCILRAQSFEDVPSTFKVNALLNLSSVIHEVYSYCSAEEILSFWDNVFNSGFKYITIRDMMISKTVQRKRGYYPYGNSMDDAQLADYCEVRNLGNKGFTELDVKNQLEFLLKYRYIENWDREVREFYFPIYLEQLLNHVAENGNYYIEYINHYTLPFIKETVKQDFDIDLIDNTHCQLILKKKEI